jgi:thiol-disulfide isomerase/thioredoxin
VANLRPCFAVIAVAAGLAGLGCELGEPSSGTEQAPAAEPEAAADGTPAVIDADWVASKFQAPPPAEAKDWAREIERDPIAALEQMDPAALQKRSGGSARGASRPAAPVKHEATYKPDAPLGGWPPVVGQFYPNIVLKDQTGQAVAISDFKGKVVLIEMVGLTCKACHAFSGGNEPGVARFRGIKPQPGLPSIERYATGYAKLSLDHPDIVFVQLVLYGMDGQSPPLAEDVRDWSQHFKLDRYDNEYVLVGDQRFISPETRALIPGFHLIDQNGILRAMSSNNPAHDPLHSALLPRLATLVKGGG